MKTFYKIGVSKRDEYNRDYISIDKIIDENKIEIRKWPRNPFKWVSTDDRIDYYIFHCEEEDLTIMKFFLPDMVICRRFSIEEGTKIFDESPRI
jgi:hypothetical protein